MTLRPFRLLTAAALCAALSAILVAVAAGSPLAPRASAHGCGPATRQEADSLRPGDARDAVLCLVNKQRNKTGLGDLDRDKRLQRAAQRHTDKMDGSGCFDHTCGGEGDLTARLTSVGYLGGGLSRWAYGENIAWGAEDLGTPRAIVKAWMNSSGHRANILSNAFHDVGVGFVAGSPSSSSTNAGIYTLDFGLRIG